MPLFPILLAAHITLAVALLVPSVALPFLLRDGRQSRPGSILLRLQGGWSWLIAVGLGATGVGLLALIGPSILRRPWLIAALVLYAANLVVAATLVRPGVRRLLHLEDRGDPRAWRRAARRQRLLAYAIAGATGLIGLLMSAKPEF